jgi:hypothetical protein
LKGIDGSAPEREQSAMAFPYGGSLDPELVARLMCRAYETGTEIDLRGIDKNLCRLALNLLINRVMLEVAAYVAPSALAAYPDARYLRSLAAILRRLPPPCEDAEFTAFRDDAKLEMQVVRRANADAVLIGFCGRVARLGMPLNLLHRWFGQLGVHVIYLRDREENNYDRGLPSLAPDFQGTLRALRKAIGELGTVRSACYGNALGSYGALRYALELGSEAVLCFAGITSLAPDFGNHERREELGIAPGIDLRPLYANAGKAPRTHLVYAEHFVSDRVQAENFAGLPTVSLEMQRDAHGHDAFVQAMREGRYEHLLRWLVDPQRGTSAP